MATPVIMPRHGQSVETCIIGEWHKNKGDLVKEGEIILSYETDKAAFDLESPATGTILEIFYQPGEDVRVLTNIAVIGQPGESTDEFKPGETSPNASASVKSGESEKTDQLTDIQKPEEHITAPDTGVDEVKISPRARSLASRLNVQISRVKGTGPGGRIIERDIEGAAVSLRTTKLASDVIGKEGKKTGKEPTGIGGQFRTGDLITETPSTEEEYITKKISNIRKIIADNMHASLQNSAQLTHHISADARKILEYRKIFKNAPEKAKGENITINDMVCYAVIKALKVKPEINSHFLGDSIKIFHKIHLGFAVDTERGLMVPALKNADDYSLPELSRALNSLADQCRNGNINPELLASTAASFTVSNLGSYGIEMFTPILNLPQAGILGVNTIIQRPADLGNGMTGFIPVIGLSLTYDHRAIDGAPASAFLKEVKDQIEGFEIDL
jgi:pyruvate dehydrogenase E2 component (dihydrolipoamide acetyltransferase)